MGTRLRPDPSFLRRAATFERALLCQHIGHPVGVIEAANDDEREGRA